MRVCWLYLETVLSIWINGYWIVTALPALTSYLMPHTATERITARFDEWVSPQIRQHVYRALIIIGLFAATFVAWKQEYYRAQNLQARSPAAGTIAVPPNVYEETVMLPHAVPLPYAVAITPSWNVTASVIHKTSEQFIISLSVPAPRRATIDWQVTPLENR